MLIGSRRLEWSLRLGGHVAEVERFAVTGVGNGSPPSLRHIE